MTGENRLTAAAPNDDDDDDDDDDKQPKPTSTTSPSPSSNTTPQLPLRRESSAAAGTTTTSNPKQKQHNFFLCYSYLINQSKEMKLSTSTLLAVVCAAAVASSTGGITGTTAFTAMTSTTTRSSNQLLLLKAATLDTDTELEKPAPKMYEKRRVVVTGLGVVNGCGIGHEEFFQACLDGKSSIGRVERFDISHMPCTIGSEIKPEQFEPADWFTNPKNVKSNDRYTHLAVAAARMALRDAKLGDTPETIEEPDKIGVMVGTAFGGMETFEQQTLKLAKNPEKPKVRYVSTHHWKTRTQKR